MEQLVDDLLLLARQDEQRIEHAEQVDLSNLIELQLDLSRDGFSLRQQRLSSELGCELLVLGQSILLQRLFRNLIDNAQRYTPNQGLISVTAQRRGCWITVAVGDSGVGLTADQLPRVFDRFWRARPDRGDDGTGLGLAIAYRICVAHGGSIRVTSKLGRAVVSWWNFLLTRRHSWVWFIWQCQIVFKLDRSLATGPNNDLDPIACPLLLPGEMTPFGGFSLAHLMIN